MQGIHNGMSASRLRVAWRKSTHGKPSVELARLPSGEVAMRNSRHPDGPVLVYTRAEIEAFVLGTKDGEFDDLIA
ncbi:DUF397 domain-containing protein [Thermoactinospora rubra]|uniref:DUF397 domain-containing protein n=1 Tax=Thermoactinospora rubra TaxID=1088767 RepID=UPI000A11FD38|nr:DUF397 domain-containing protein [Thermoactinospora rubra]